MHTRIIHKSLNNMKLNKLRRHMIPFQTVTKTKIRAISNFDKNLLF